MAKKTLSNYINELKQIRPFAHGFEASDGYDIRRATEWSPAMKRQITRYWTAIRDQAAVSSYVYRPRRADHLKAALAARGVSQFTQLKAAFIPVPAERGPDGKMHPVKPEINVSSTGEFKVRVESHGSQRDYLLYENFGYSALDFIDDPQAVVQGILDQTDYRYYNIVTGEYELGRGAPKLMKPPTVIKRLQELITNYSADRYDPNDTNSSYFGNWLFGLVGYNFPSVPASREYVQSQREFSNERQAFNKRKRQIKEAIERIEKDISRIQRHRRVSDWISRLAQLTITRDLKATTNQKTIAMLLRARERVRQTRGKMLQPWLRKYLLQEKQRQIAHQDSILDAMVRERLHRSTFKT